MPRTTPRRSARTTPGHGMRTFVHIFVNTAVANLATSFLWLGLTFWIYAETRNVIASGAVGGAYMLFVSACSMLFGTLVDRMEITRRAHMVDAKRTARGELKTSNPHGGGLYPSGVDDRLNILEGPHTLKCLIHLI